MRHGNAKICSFCVGYHCLHWYHSLHLQLQKSKQSQKGFQDFRQSCLLSTDRIKIHQSQPLVWPSDLLYIMLVGCDWQISIQSGNNMHDWWKSWICFQWCFDFWSCVSMQTVVNAFDCSSNLHQYITQHSIRKYAWTRYFMKKNVMKNTGKSVSELLEFDIIWERGVCFLNPSILPCLSQ